MAFAFVLPSVCAYGFMQNPLCFLNIFIGNNGPMQAMAADQGNCTEQTRREVGARPCCFLHPT